MTFEAMTYESYESGAPPSQPLPQAKAPHSNALTAPDPCHRAQRGREAPPGGFVEVEDYAAAVVEGFAAEFEQALEGVGADGALLHAGLGVAGDGRVHGGWLTCPSDGARKAKPGSPIKALGDDGERRGRREDCEDSRSAILTNKRPRDPAGSSLNFGSMEKTCPFCVPEPSRLLVSEGLVFALRDGYPVSPGHSLIVPRRHVGSFGEASPRYRGDRPDPRGGIRWIIPEKADYWSGRGK